MGKSGIRIAGKEESERDPESLLHRLDPEMMCAAAANPKEWRILLL
jgi:hypothetical protein